MNIAREIIVTGLVQGIGFRPFVAEMAEKLNISGTVRNSGGIVKIIAQGTDEDVVCFSEAIEKCDIGARIDSYIIKDAEVGDYEGFQIVESTSDERIIPYIPADIATCKRCESELNDKNNRRYHHSFISCVSCGPRYSIIEKLPYDRPRITMKGFELCFDCKNEYTQKKNIRRHAQTIACPECGPILSFYNIRTGKSVSGRLDEAINEASKVIMAGGIVAMKDIGGYHLICNPYSEEAVARLRKLKHRERKPFAVCFPKISIIEKYCHVGSCEAELLNSSARPIVLLEKKNENESTEKFADGVCLSSRKIGAMLPCNPQQLLLTQECGPLIMTSGNGSGELLIIDDELMKNWLMEKYDEIFEDEVFDIAILSHDRPIITPLDDSVARVVNDKNVLIRRARGYVPEPVEIAANSCMNNAIEKNSVFAAGGDLKSVFGFMEGSRFYPGAHLGDLVDCSSQAEFINQKARMQDLFGFEPKCVAIDKHPGYISRELVKEKIKNFDYKVFEIQHHKAHIASVVAEHSLSGEVLGFAFDGTGYGDDGTIWGGEVFYWDACEKNGQAEIKRIGHIKQVSLIGSDEGAKNTDTILYGFLSSTNGIVESLDLELSSERKANKELVEKAISMGINVVKSTSMGRLFDAVSALLDCCHYNSYEGEAPIELEYIAACAKDEESNIFEIQSLIIEDYVLDTTELIKQAIAGLKIHSKEVVARSFINLISDYIIYLAEKKKVNQIVLSGGTFNNEILLSRTIRLLEEKKYKVYINEKMPCSDGGICLGQAYLARLEVK